MFGTNLKRPPTKGDGSVLEVQHIFPTIQGEGPYVGQPAIFIRLGGCNLACSFCDTEFESFKSRSLQDILNCVDAFNAARIYQLIVITGGEPLRQPLAKLCSALEAQGYHVQIETNGTYYQDLPDTVSIICSPKAPTGTYHAIRPDLLPKITAFKFIISEDDPGYRHVPEVGQSVYQTPVYIQPMDEQDAKQNKKNRNYAVALCQQHGYFLSLQIHKILRIE